MYGNEKDILVEIIDKAVKNFIINKLKKVKEYRKQNKWTQKQMAINAALSRELIQRLEYKETTLTLESYVKIALALKEFDILVTLDDLEELQKEIDNEYETILKVSTQRNN